MTEWLVMEAYNDLYYTTGVTYQADNQPDPDNGRRCRRRRQSTLPIIGLSGTMDWGVHSYDPGHEWSRSAQRRHRRHGQSTTRPATNSTRDTRPSRTGSPACPDLPRRALRARAVRRPGHADLRRGRQLRARARTGRTSGSEPADQHVPDRDLADARSRTTTATASPRRRRRRRCSTPPISRSPLRTATASRHH